MHPGAGQGRKRENMDRKPLPHRANLRHLRRQARELQRESRESLQLAQHKLAQTYGFASWAELKATLDAARTIDEEFPPLLGKHAFERLRDDGRLPSPTEILPALNHPNPKVRYACLGLLDHLADETCVPAIVASIADPVPRVRRMAVHAVGCQRCKPTALCTDLTSVLLQVAEHDPVWRVRQEAVIALLGQPETHRVLESLDRLATDDPHAEVRKQAGWCASILRGEPASWGSKRR